MTLESYWLAMPLIGIALSGFGWLALMITRLCAPAKQRRGSAIDRRL